MTSQQNLGLVLFLGTALMAEEGMSGASTVQPSREQPRALDVRASKSRVSAKASTPASRALVVTYPEGYLSVSAQRVSLARILREVAHGTGIEVQGAEVLGERISVNFSDIRLGEALRRLLAHRADYILVEQNSAQRDTPRIRLLVHREATSQPSETSQATEMEALEVGGDQWNPTRLSQGLNDPDLKVRLATAETLGHSKSALAAEALVEATRDPAPSVRIAALRSLAYYVRDGSARAALEQGLVDEDQSVQAAAAELLKTFAVEESLRR